MVNRRQRAAPAKLPDPAPLPAWPADRHSGEGSASALETLHRLEAGRVARQPEDAREEPAPSRSAEEP